MSKEIVVDARGLEPPEPLERVLTAISSLKQDEFVRLLIDCEPHPLYGILTRNGYVHATRDAGGGVYEVRIWMKGA